MTTSKLPARPSLESLRKQAKKLARGIVAGHAGAVVAPSVCDGLIVSRTKGLLDLFHRRGLLPQSLRFFAALGDVNGVRACLDANGDDLAAVNQAFTCAYRLQHATAAALLLDRSITLDAGLGRQIDGGQRPSAFAQYII